MKSLSRRQFLRMTTVATAGAFLAACQKTPVATETAAEPAPTATPAAPEPVTLQVKASNPEYQNGGWM